MRLIEQIIFTLWVKLLFKELMILQYTQRKNFIETLQTQANGDNSYLFANGKQELKFKAKTDQLVKEKLCI